MSRTRQYNKANGEKQDEATPVAERNTATWQMYDPEAHYRKICEASRIKYGNRFHPGEVRNNSDFVKFLLRNVDALIEAVRPEPVA